MKKYSIKEKCLINLSSWGLFSNRAYLKSQECLDGAYFRSGAYFLFILEDIIEEEEYYHLPKTNQDCSSLAIESHSCQTYEDHATQTEDEDSENELKEDIADTDLYQQGFQKGKSFLTTS